MFTGDREKLLILDSIEAFLDAKVADGLSERALTCYRRDLYRLRDFLRSRRVLSVTEITEKHARLFNAELIRSMKDLTRRRAIALVKMWLAWVVENGHLPAPHAFADVAIPSQSSQNTKSLAITQEMIDSVDGVDVASLRDKAILQVMRSTCSPAAAIVTMMDEHVHNDGSLLEIRGRKYDVDAKTATAVRRYMLARDEEVAKKTGMVTGLWVSFSGLSWGRRLSAKGLTDLIRSRRRLAHIS